MAYYNTPRCPSCPNTHRCVSGHGDRPTRVMMIGERPGIEDDRVGTLPYTGRSSQEFNENYLRLAGLRRDDIYFTNTVKCRNADHTRKPTPHEIQECGGFFLGDEIEMCSPEVVVLLGATACSIIPDIDLDTEHGLPRYGQELFGWVGTVVPMYHPSSGMHDTSTMIPLLEDFERLRGVLNGTYTPPDPIPPGDYRLLEVFTNDGRENVPELRDNDNIAIDTETYNGDPFSIQSCWVPGIAFFTRTGLEKEMEVAKRVMGSGTMLEFLQSVMGGKWYGKVGSIILHNAPQDLDILEKAGIHINPSRIRDTMQEAYHLGNLPQGLKALAYRLLGVRMKSYSDVVMPPSRDKALDWIVNALETISDKWKVRTTQQLKTKLKVTLKPTPQEQGLRRILKHGCFSDEYDIWKKVQELREGTVSGRVDPCPIWSDVDSTWGPIPLPGIANVELAEAVRYGCMDADITLRVANRLAEMRKEREQGIGVAEEDKDTVVGGVAKRILRK